MQGFLRWVQRFLLTYIMLTIGATIGALAVMIFLAPNDIAPGGVSGIAVISNRVIGTPIGLVVLILNIPIQILAWRLLPGGWRNIVRAIYVISVYTVVLDFMGPVFADFETSPDPLLNAIFGGVLGGIGHGIVIRAGGNFGGTSTIALIIQRRIGLPLSSIYLYTDVLIIGAAAYFFSINAALLAIITLFMDGVAANYIMEGPSLIRTAFIVTDKPEEVSREVMRRLDRGMTSWSAKGMYTGQDRTVLYISVARSQITQLRRIISKIDPDAFVVIGQGHTAYGEGFRKRIAPVLDMNDGSEKE